MSEIISKDIINHKKEDNPLFKFYINKGDSKINLYTYLDKEPKISEKYIKD